MSFGIGSGLTNLPDRPPRCRIEQMVESCSAWCFLPCFPRLLEWLLMTCSTDMVSVTVRGAAVHFSHGRTRQSTALLGAESQFRSVENAHEKDRWCPMKGHIRKRGKAWAIVVKLGKDAQGKRWQKWQRPYTELRKKRRRN